MPHLLPRPLIAAVLAAAVVVSLGVVSAGADTTDQLEATRDRIESTLSDLRAVEGRAEQSAAEVAEAEARVAQLEQDLNALLEQMLAQQARVDEASARADAAAAERDRIREVVNARARNAWMGSAPSPIMVLGGQGVEAVEEALEQLALLDALAGRADASMESLDVAQVQAEVSAARLEEEVAALRAVQETHEQVLAEAQAVLGARAAALADLEAEQERLLAEAEVLEDREADLQRIIAREEEARRRAEEERLRQEQAARDSGGATDEPTAEPPAAAEPASGCYQWPADGRVTSEYGPRWGRMHAGIDIDGDTGDPIVAAQNGTVIHAGWYYDYGNTTMISHSDGVTTLYAHQSSLSVQEGDVVTRGQVIGKMGATGRVTGSHLHFETRTSSGAKNPRNYLC